MKSTGIRSTPTSAVAATTADQAQDLTQEFFARLLERDFLGAADPEKGRFRAFLLASCKNFLANEHDRAAARKRGGGRAPLSLGDAEKIYSREASHEATPEKLFERRWALTLLDRVLAVLREEFTARGKGELFDRLRLYLVGDRGAPRSSRRPASWACPSGRSRWRCIGCGSATGN